MSDCIACDYESDGFVPLDAERLSVVGACKQFTVDTVIVCMCPHHRQMFDKMFRDAMTDEPPGEKPS
jgi:hypothetical protein